ncbi:hypothetical protein HPP92_027368 [Vanilla planifolia]|uniref:Uncharacterized protein n=1 Tax=Vanilla planifolia TaxID=51239 RepID=A0A835PBU1_VANPL|nr:hypothetical protein HPP92_027368 [Vanilla planifolia]
MVKTDLQIVEPTKYRAEDPNPWLPQKQASLNKKLRGLYHQHFHKATPENSSVSLGKPQGNSAILIAQSSLELLGHLQLNRTVKVVPEIVFA